jgi:MFS superfamily sulfate permease-like transporter
MKSHTAAPTTLDRLEKPENGIKGLKHWKQDLLAGLIVSLVSVPLSLGIAVASGAPPIAGLISSIVAGLVIPFLGGAYVTINGPAAGLAPIIFASIINLGHNNLEIGYRAVLAAIFFAGLLQIALSHMKAARFSAMFPASAIEGMLASIGLMIIAKQLPNFIGHKFQNHEFFGIVAELPKQLLQIQPGVVAVSTLCLAALFIYPRFQIGRLKYVPAQLLVVPLGILLGFLFHLDAQYLIHVPANPIQHGLVFPDFGYLFTSANMLWSTIACVVSLALVDGFESLATIMAVDRMDPFHRKADPDRTLFAVGFSKICSSLVGGLTIIPGGIKSTVCLMSGGRTLWANFYNALFLMLFLFLGSHVINLIPLGALAAVLIHIGFKLCQPKKWQYIASIGTEQLLIYASTIVVTLCSDLLLGLLFGMLLKLVLLWSISVQNCVREQHAPLSARLLWQTLLELFSNPVSSQQTRHGVHDIRFDKPVVSFNSIHLARALSTIPGNAKTVRLYFAHSVKLIDHTSVTSLLDFEETFKREKRGNLELIGLDRMRMQSSNEASLRSVRIAH